MGGRKSEGVRGGLVGACVLLVANVRYRLAERSSRREREREAAGLGDAAPERVYHRLSILGRPLKKGEGGKQETQAEIRERASADFYQCANCQRIYPFESLSEIEDYWERVDVEDRCVPDGECPQCGALCYHMEAVPTKEYLTYCNDVNAADPRD